MNIESKGLIKSKLIEDYISKNTIAQMCVNSVYCKCLVEYKFNMCTNNKYTKVSTYIIDVNNLSIMRTYTYGYK